LSPSFCAQQCEAGNVVDLDSNLTKFIDIVQIGRPLLMTRGSLTTFSIANDVAKCFPPFPWPLPRPIRNSRRRTSCD
jgi:high-affinity K+ transport system ATPase subunit B